MTDRKDYREICRLASQDDAVFKIFKKHKDYRNVLEHVTQKQGQAYSDIIKKEGKDFLSYFPKFKENDKFGSPVTFHYRVGKFSPTTLRYIKVLVDLKNIFGSLNGMDIIEIGGGYGGQCKIISDLFKFKSYTLVDLDVVLLLAQKYLTKLGVKKVNFLKPDEIRKKKEYDLIISNYAFSECTKEIQDKYINKILNKAKRGYITYNYDLKNTPHPISPYNKKQITQILSKKHHLQLLEEKPKTGPTNFIIVWGNSY